MIEDVLMVMMMMFELFEIFPCSAAVMMMISSN